MPDHPSAPDDQLSKETAMSTTDNDSLTKTITSVTDAWDEPLDEVHDVRPIVNAILAAGWQPPSDPALAVYEESLAMGLSEAEAQEDAWPRA